MKFEIIKFKEIVIAIALLILFLLPFLKFSDYYLHIFILSGIFILLVLGMNLLMGYTGLIQVGHAAFFGIGAYIAALGSKHFHTFFWINLPISGVLTAFTGFILGIITIRMGGVYLAICTFGFNIIVSELLGNLRAITGGHLGVIGIPSPHIPVINFTFSSKISYYYLIVLIVLLNILVFNRLINGKTGRALMAIREDEIAAEANGVNILYYKILSFSIAAFMAGEAGAFYAHYINFISPETFGIMQSVYILAMAIIGGLGSIIGSIVGAILLSFLPELLRIVGEFRMIVYGLLLLLTILFFPGGIAGLGKKIISIFLKE